MRISELAAAAGINRKTIRYYESIGVLPEPERTPSGYRTYTERDADRVAFIKAAQRLGMRLDEIREVLALRENGQRPCGYVRQVLRQQVGDINRRIAELERLRDELVALDAIADKLTDTADGPGCPLIEHASPPRTSVPTG